MNRLRVLFVAASAFVFAMLSAGPILAAIRTQQAQIGITIVVNVAPSVAYIPHQIAPSSSAGTIAARMSFHEVARPAQHTFYADSLHFVGASSKVIAQAQVQHGILVQAEVTPNPNATLLYSDDSTGTNPLTSVSINATAGTTVVEPCIFTVTADSTKSWSLEQGVSSNFTTSWNGDTVGNNVYVLGATPRPTATPYAVYANDGGVWTIVESGATKTTYCVDLTVTVPGTITAGTYSTNAIYTLYY